MKTLTIAALFAALATPVIAQQKTEDHTAHHRDRYSASPMTARSSAAAATGRLSAKAARALWTAAAMTALIGTFFLLREHWGHVAGYWPYLLLLACTLMHLFHGHGGHGHHTGHGTGTKPLADREE